MHSILYFYLICFVVLTLYSHSRITCDARTLNEDAPKSAAKTNSTKTVSRTEAAGSNKLLAETDAVPLDNCRCIPPIYCNAEFGENILMERFTSCDIGEICCPDNLLKSPGEAPSTPASIIECGMRRGDPLKVPFSGGSSVVFGEFPWMVLLIEKKNNKEDIFCGASLVSSTIVLTAAHCVYQKSVKSLIVRAGEFDLSLASPKEKMPHQDRSIKNFTVHSDYLNKTLIHDLALLIVDRPFTYESNVAPVCLPLVRSPYSPFDVEIYDFDKCIATGWGIKSNNDMTKPVTLSKIDLKLVPTNQCVQLLRKSALGPKFILHPSLICAIGARGTNMCKGDGGGPLICPLKENSDKFVQVGVIAGGLDCGSPYPSLYASLLQANSEWIREEISIISIY